MIEILDKPTHKNDDPRYTPEAIERVREELFKRMNSPDKTPYNQEEFKSYIANLYKDK